MSNGQRSRSQGRGHIVAASRLSLFEIITVAKRGRYPRQHFANVWSVGYQLHSSFSSVHAGVKA